MNIWHSLAGMVEAELTSADPGRALQEAAAAGITLFDATVQDITLHFRLRRIDWRRLKRLCDRRGWGLKPVGKRGLYWAAKGLLRRPVLVAGLGIVLALSLYLPTRVLFISVEGNGTVPINRILEGAEQCGIRFGASRREVRSEIMKNALLQAVPELQWAGINTYGCRAVITVTQRQEPELEKKPAGVSSVVAVRDGVIISATATKGSLQCQPGEAVKAGQTLISGYTDCGILLQATRAEGEVFAETSRYIQAILPENWEREGEIIRTEKKYALIVGKNRINFYKGSGISPPGCDKMYTQYYVTLPGGFQLPVALVCETWCYRETDTVAVEASSAEDVLKDFVCRYLLQQMQAGQILSGSDATELCEGVFTLAGNYSCREMIGRVRSEEIIKPNGKFDRTDRQRRAGGGPDRRVWLF